MAVHVPKVRAESGVTGDVEGIVLAGMPLGRDFPPRVGSAGPQYTFLVAEREAYAWMLFASDTTEIWRFWLERRLNIVGSMDGVQRGATWVTSPRPGEGNRILNSSLICLDCNNFNCVAQE